VTDLNSQSGSPTSTQTKSGSSPASNEPNDVQAFLSAAESAQPGLLREFFDFLVEYRLWWLTPIVISLLLLAGLAFLSTTAIAPFIYPVW
jgi:Family of unknown function (DUF5989)